MTIEINQEKLLLIQEEKLKLEEYFILLCLFKEEQSLLGVFDQNLKSVEVALHYQKLFRTGYIVLSNENTEDLYQLTKKGYEFINKIEN